MIPFSSTLLPSPSSGISSFNFRLPSLICLGVLICPPNISFSPTSRPVLTFFSVTSSSSSIISLPSLENSKVADCFEIGFLLGFDPTTFFCHFWIQQIHSLSTFNNPSAAFLEVFSFILFFSGIIHLRVSKYILPCFNFRHFLFFLCISSEASLPFGFFLFASSF